MKTIVAIGGGSMRERKTLAIDRAIVALAGKKHPRALLIPTASSDAENYLPVFRKIYGKALGCTVDELLLILEKPTIDEIRKKISAADIIYVGGGNTLMMMKLWRRLGVDKLLKEAYRRGAICCGVSAGSICWFESGHSDSLSFYNPKKWEYIRVKGLDLIKAIHCPHYDSKTLGVPRRKNFQRMIQKRGGTGIAIDDHCAIEFRDGRIHRVLRAAKNAGAYRVVRKQGKVLEEPIT